MEIEQQQNTFTQRSLPVAPLSGKPTSIEIFLLAPPFICTSLLALLSGYLTVMALAFAFASLAVAFTPRPIGTKWRMRGAILFVVLVTTLSQVILMQAQTAVDVLGQRVEAQGADAMDPVETIGVYLVSYAMTFGGYVAGYPEVAKEHSYLHKRGPKSRVFRSDFPSKSRKIRAALDGFIASIPPGAPGAAMEPKLIAFKPGDEVQRVYLALNPATVSANATRHGDKIKVTAKAVVEVKYPQKARVQLGEYLGEEIHMEEGIFWALQEKGWLHPYKAVWTWTYEGRATVAAAKP